MIDLTPRVIARTLAVRRRARAWTAGVAGYGLVLSLGLAGAAWMMPRERIAEERLVRATADVDAAKRELAGLSAEVSQLQRRLAAARAVGEHPDWSVALGVIAGARGDLPIALERATLVPVAPVVESAPRRGRAAARGARPEPTLVDPPAPAGYVLTLRGIGANEVAASRYALALEEARVFDRVTLVSTRQREVGGEARTSFEITLELREGAASGREGGTP
jgi:hypothetical protein